MGVGRMRERSTQGVALPGVRQTWQCRRLGNTAVFLIRGASRNIRCARVGGSIAAAQQPYWPNHSARSQPRLRLKLSVPHAEKGRQTTIPRESFA